MKKDYKLWEPIKRSVHNEVCWTIPLTNSLKQGHYYFNFKIGERKSRAIISQIRLVDAKRFKYKIGTISKDEFESLKIKIRQLIA